MTIVPDERVETLLRALADHFASFGGVPLLAVFDRPKIIALHWASDGTVTEWNPTFAEVALDLGIGVEVWWPRRPKQKGYAWAHAREVGPPGIEPGRRASGGGF